MAESANTATAKNISNQESPSTLSTFQHENNNSTQSASDFDVSIAESCEKFSLSSQEQEQINENNIPLDTSWTFWIDKTTRGTSVAEYEANLKKLYTVDTVQAFWRVYNNLPKPALLSPRYSYHLMRHESRPVWEDKANCNGGHWRMKCFKQNTNEVWQELTLAAIGEQFSECMDHADDVIGLSVSIRDRDDIVQVWNKLSGLAERATIVNKVKHLLPSIQFTTVFYKAFESHEAFEKGKN